MSTVGDVTMLPSLLNFDPIVVHRLKRMRYIRRIKRPINIFKRWDNCLRGEMDGLFCLRRNKYVTRLGLYYWNHLREKNCEECGRMQEPEWHSHEHPYIVMMKAAPVVGGGLDFARVAIGLGLELACFGSFLATESKGTLSRSSDGKKTVTSDRSDCTNTRDRNVHAASLDLSLRDYNCEEMHDDEFLHVGEGEHDESNVIFEDFTPDSEAKVESAKAKKHRKQQRPARGAQKVKNAATTVGKLSSGKNVSGTSRLRTVVAKQAARKNRIMLSA